jgi:CobQ-like glutamine amidotransferase family enzyme
VIRRQLRLGHLYPKEMNLYGDRGNILALLRRAELRGVDLEVVEIGLGTTPLGLLESCSGFFMGGGQDLDQGSVAADLISHKGEALRAAVTAGKPLLAVCAGYQLLGTHYLTGAGTRIPGLGLLPLHTEAGRRRLVGNLMVAADPGLGLKDPILVGFENHSGRTVLHPGLRPLGSVVHGGGNDGQSGKEGAWQGTVVATYLHGPLLPKNPSLSDWWLRTAAGEPSLEELDDSLEEAAREEAIALTAHPPRMSRWRLLGRGLVRRGS